MTEIKTPEWLKTELEKRKKAAVIKRTCSGRRVDLENRYFRSKWEANYARYLNFLIKCNELLKWEYEIDEFEFKGIKRGNRFYKTDFKVYSLNGEFEYHEVKGYYDKKSLTKLRRMKKYFPETKIVMIDGDWFKHNTANLKAILKNWE